MVGPGSWLSDNVPEDVKQRRLAEIIALQQRITGEIYKAQIGKRERVLLECPSRLSTWHFFGRTDTFRAAVVPVGPGVTRPASVDVVIDRATNAALFGLVVYQLRQQ